MYGGGYYPLMDSVEWANAPWNEPEPVYETCPECNGECGVWVNEDGDEIHEAEYKRLSDEDKALWDFIECEQCNGEGEVLVEDDYDDDCWDED